MKSRLIFTLVLGLPGWVWAGHQTQWIPEKSRISYTVTHPLHEVHGISSSARGKGVCYGTYCAFLVAVPVKSFVSGDDNRDLHMQQVTRAALYPLVEVTARMEGFDAGKRPASVTADLTVNFAGKKAVYPGVKLELSGWKKDEVHVKGVIPLRLKDFDIRPPTLLAMPIRDKVPVSLEMFWKRSTLN
jgi:YceI-like domain